MGPNIAIIGAGPTGLTAAIELKRRGLTPTLFEARNCLGGQWAYEVLSDEPVDIRDPQSQSVSSAMYPRLWTNLPKYSMQISDYPLPEELQPFPGRVDVLDYISATAKAAGIVPLIRFNSPVKQLSKVAGGWLLETEEKREIFTHVMVASGKDSHPNIPEIEGLDSFDGPVIHSQSYRLPEIHEGKRVVLIGACVSSEDISLDLSPHAEQVYICGTFPPNGHKCYVRDGLYGDGFNISQHARPKRVEGNKVILQNGEVLYDVDTIILCTGYIYRFPFLEGELDDIELSGQTMGPLYLNMFYPTDPSLIFLGLPRFTVHFANVHLQSVYCAQILSGEQSLPSLADIQKEAHDGSCVLQRLPSDLNAYHECAFENFTKLCKLSGEPNLDWQRLLTELNDHKRLHQQYYRQYPFEFKLKEMPFPDT
ncbi:NAD(P)-binding domain-containing protein [Pseudovibrio sp. Tun.PSC04-5.I4]|uniref:NAD(P)-binding domain-containing protein n=1 Tax=Pseudovibrio sp. Tun.PSC04-5.I4 TaxID=1798213 RepID=UPI000882C76D|nr:NAD(P)-binding domain-containing protein [Pseudovibrio sp. Tun.PSC04-5.I4]SDQ23268.1 trimethylamine monooxygenase [Pseudovibrio sp. Tun.PSC04-5.I4]